MCLSVQKHLNISDFGGSGHREPTECLIFRRWQCCATLAL
ncbi:hypothetical protein D805_1176 [Bifidobacterium thermophilum RBL67]|uniref:Uncharacterized protein n=1 Tax=Bifidobacterium thermophilum RBL67 TaxID=1254439 RepID=M4RFW2_9BIFI|nr:hypothetical protein D805_1176 [Bifidobacterium thermophilum RBL67]